MLDQKIYPTNIFQLEQQFYQQLIKYSQQVNIYEDPVLQTQALSVIPLDKLKSSVRDKLNNNDDKCPKFKHQLILELLRWFKLDFFSWVDSPTCPNCSNNNGPSKTAFFENLSPTAQELSDQGHRVDVVTRHELETKKLRKLGKGKFLSHSDYIKDVDGGGHTSLGNEMTQEEGKRRKSASKDMFCVHDASVRDA